MANHHPQLKKHRLDSDYPYENGHMTGELNALRHADTFRRNFSAYLFF
jgi:hypothetical protein